MLNSSTELRKLLDKAERFTASSAARTESFLQYEDSKASEFAFTVALSILHSPVTREQLNAAGISNYWIDRGLRAVERHREEAQK